MTPRPLLIARGLTMWRGERRLFNELDVTVHAGRVLHLRGANGFGKTTLLRILSGLLLPEEGSLVLEDEPFPAAQARARATVGYLGHIDGLKLDLTAVENLRFAMRIGGMNDAVTDDEAAQLSPESLMARVGLQAQRDVQTRYLSAGQRRRLAIARLLGGQHRLWLLDEPFTTLDDAGVNLLLELIAQAISDGIGVVLSSHQPVAVDEQHLDVLDLGRVNDSASSGSASMHAPRSAQ